jgi:hypothetical protein
MSKSQRREPRRALGRASDSAGKGGCLTSAKGANVRCPFCPRPGFQKRFGDESSASGRMLISSKNFAEFFAELRAEKAPKRPFGSTLLR